MGGCVARVSGLEVCVEACVEEGKCVEGWPGCVRACVLCALCEGSCVCVDPRAEGEVAGLRRVCGVCSCVAWAGLVGEDGCVVPEGREEDEEDGAASLINAYTHTHTHTA